MRRDRIIWYYTSLESLPVSLALWASGFKSSHERENPSPGATKTYQKPKVFGRSRKLRFRNPYKR